MYAHAYVAKMLHTNERGTDIMSDFLLEQLASIHSVEEAEAVILTLGEEILKAPNNQRRKNLREIRKLVQHAIKDNLLPAARWDEAISELEGYWKQVVELLLPYAPAEVQEKVGDLARELFSHIREDLVD